MSESIEMYLETILVLQKRNGRVRAVDIAHEMNFSKPTISQQMRRLKDKGLIDITDAEGIILTDEGQAIGQKIFERHNVLSKIFKHIGISDETAVDDACRVEHYISDETFDALKVYFKDVVE